MVALKQNNAEYIPFYNYLQSLPANNIYNSFIDSFSVKKVTDEEANNAGQMPFFFDILFSFEAEISDVKDAYKMNEIFCKSLKKIIPVKEQNLLFLDEKKLTFVPVEKEYNAKTVGEINNYYKEGVIQLLFEKKSPQIFPVLNEYTSNGSKLNFLLYPIFDDNKPRGILSLLTPSSSETITAAEKNIVGILLNIFLNKADKILLKNQLSSAYNELQTYQAKLANDFRLSAIGEMTHGIVEDIISPLQVITSQVDFLKSKVEDDEEINRLKAQIKKIAMVVSRVVKFSNIGKTSISIEPCNINDLINEYYNLMKTSLTNSNYELVLDLEKDIPSILTHPNYVFQMLTNLFEILKNENKEKVGIIVQTRFVTDKVVLKILSTGSVRKDRKGKSINNINLRMLENLVKKHEALMRIESHQQDGTNISVSFPLKRKIRE